MADFSEFRHPALITIDLPVTSFDVRHFTNEKGEDNSYIVASIDDPNVSRAYIPIKYEKDLIEAEKVQTAIFSQLLNAGKTDLKPSPVLLSGSISLRDGKLNISIK